MPLQSTAGAATYDAFGGGLPGGSAMYIEDVFSTYLYTGNGSTQTITNGIPLASTAEFWGVKFKQNDSYGYGISTDSSGNVYVTGDAYDSDFYAFIAKYNTSGTLQWQRKFRENGSYGRGISTDSSGNVYVTGSASYDGVYAFIAKYNTSGTLQWQRKFRENGSYGRSISTDSSGNVYVTGLADDGDFYAFIAKYNTSGTLQWQRKFRQSSSSQGYGIATDSSGNVYVTGIAIDGDGYAFIAKYNTSGTLQWQRKFRQSSSVGRSIATDSSGNVYVTGLADDDNSYAFIAKYNTSGTLQWQRKFRENGSDGYGISTDSSGNVYVTGTANDGGVYAYILELAQDGSTTSGTVNNGNLNNGTATDSVGTATDSAGTATDSSGTATDSAGTATDSAGTATSTTQTQVAVEGKGGLVWIKSRSAVSENCVYTTDIGSGKRLITNRTDALDASVPTDLTAFNSNGFNLGVGGNVNTNAATYASWTSRKAAKFFDVVTYTGNGSTQAISHNLGSVPGCIIAKRTNNTGSWRVFHRSVGTEYGNLNSSAAFQTTNAQNVWGDNSTTVAPTSTQFTVGNDSSLNASGSTYVAYLFAHDAGGFGASGTDNVISCGSFTTDVNGQATVNIGYEPQFILTKTTTNTGSDQWVLVDSMRGLCTAGLFLGLPTSNNPPLWPNLSQNEGGSTNIGGTPTSTGFTWNSSSSGTHIYIAIRRGPMRTPTSGTSVFEPVAATQGLNSSTPATSSITDDTFISSGRTSGSVQFNVGDRLRGGNFIFTQGVDAESTFSYYDWGRQTGVAFTANLTTSGSLIMYHLRRAPGFFDVVCYTGTGSTTTFNHNLRALPEMMIIKRRDTSADWWVYDAATGNTKYQVLNSTATPTTSSTAWNNTTPTSSVFSVGTGTPVNASAGTYVAYLFASVPGVSKVFSYTGNGSSQTINCGFTAGARFVLIKRTDAAGDWYVWDSARGIVAGNDPRLSLNSTAAEVTTDDSVDTDNTGFVVNQVAATNINVTSGTYIGLAIA